MAHGKALVRAPKAKGLAKPSSIVYSFKLYEYGGVMPRTAVDENRRLSLRVRPEQKATLMRAAALRNTDLTDFVLQPALREAAAIIEAADHVTLSERDSLRVLDLLENPPPANAKLREAAKAMPNNG
jgi:uncharacterized protein (DUF1778 family)